MKNTFFLLLLFLCWDTPYVCCFSELDVLTQPSPYEVLSNSTHTNDEIAPSSSSPRPILFVIATEQHSGSHFVRGLLDSHPQINVDDEILLWRVNRAGMSCASILGVESRKKKLKTAQVIKKMNLIAWGINHFPQHEAKQYVDCLQQIPGCPHSGGVKGYLSYMNSFRALGFIFHVKQGLSLSLSRKHFLSEFAKFNVKVIYLHRLNAVAQSISTSNIIFNQDTNHSSKVVDTILSEQQLNASKKVEARLYRFQEEEEKRHQDRDLTRYRLQEQEKEEESVLNVSVESIVINNAQASNKSTERREEIIALQVLTPSTVKREALTSYQIHQAVINDFKQYPTISVLYVPYETINARHEQTIQLFRFLNITDLSYDESGMLFSHNSMKNIKTMNSLQVEIQKSSNMERIWKKEVSSKTKHHKLKTFEYIQNFEAMLSVLSNSTIRDSYNRSILCTCMLYDNCDFGEVTELLPTISNSSLASSQDESMVNQSPIQKMRYDLMHHSYQQKDNLNHSSRILMLQTEKPAMTSQKEEKEEVRMTRRTAVVVEVEGIHQLPFNKFQLPVCSHEVGSKQPLMSRKSSMSRPSSVKDFLKDKEALDRYKLRVAHPVEVITNEIKEETNTT